MNAGVKKALLSVAFIVVFGIYVIYQRGNADNNNLIIDNKNTVSSLPANATAHVQNTGPKIMQNSGMMRNGTYTGSSADAFYGIVQVQAVISGGKLTDINFLSYPNDRQHSQQLSNYALPQLKTEAIRAQSSNVDVISGATATSEAFIQSLSFALSQAS